MGKMEEQWDRLLSSPKIKGTISFKRQLSIDSYRKGINTSNRFAQATGMTIALCHVPQEKMTKVNFP